MSQVHGYWLLLQAPLLFYPTTDLGISGFSLCCSFFSSSWLTLLCLALLKPGGSFVDLGVRNPSPTPSDIAPTSLLQSAELLAGLILDSPQKQSSVLSDVDSKSASHMDLQSSGLQSNNPVTEGGESRNEETIFPAAAPAALNQLVIFHHLPDLCAAFIQLAVSGRDDVRSFTSVRCPGQSRSWHILHTFNHWKDLKVFRFRVCRDWRGQIELWMPLVRKS